MVSVTNLSSFSVSEKKLAQKIKKILRLLRQPQRVYLEVFLLETPAMRALNRKFCKKDTTATVLSFSGDGFPVGKYKPLGEIYLCPAVIKKKGVPFPVMSQEIETYLIYYLIHGILHQLGYDHKGSKKTAYRMEQKEQEIWRKMTREMTKSNP